MANWTTNWRRPPERVPEQSEVARHGRRGKGGQSISSKAWQELMQSSDERIRLDPFRYLSDRAFGRPGAVDTGRSKQAR